MYRAVFDHALTKVSAEKVHRGTLSVLKGIQASSTAQEAVRASVGRTDVTLATQVFGRVVPGPLGLAAGFDKDAEAMDALGAFGFGFVEIGTVTAHPQPGNPQPRLFRLPHDRAILNRMGFNNVGSLAVAKRLWQRQQHGAHQLVLGVNIGKSKVTPPEHAAGDYELSASRLAPYADYLVVNVSSPNTPGLRDLQVTSTLRPLLSRVQDASVKAAGRTVPVLVKIAPDLADEDVISVADVVTELGLAGVVATNTTIRRDGLRTPARVVAEYGNGGLSGPLLRERALSTLRIIRDRVPRETVVISVGGITTVEDAWDRIEAGANLLQGYTAMVYEGPKWPSRIHAGLTTKLAAHRYGTLAEAIAAYS